MGGIIASVIVNKHNLENHYLMENQFYAQKLADTTDLLFMDMFQNLEAESEDKAFLTSDPDAILVKLNKLIKSTNYFNSIFFADKTGHLVNVAPSMTEPGALLNSNGPKEAIEKKIPLISEPYMGIIGKLMILISVPVFNENYEYVGFLGGTIYLHENNSLKSILGHQPEHKNESYVFVVDSKGNIIYHPNPARINDNVLENEVVQKLTKGLGGNEVVANTQGIMMLAGYAPLRSTNKWGIVFQTPADTIIKPTIDVVKRISLISIPFIIFVFFLSSYMLKKIVNPIHELALYAKRITEKKEGSPPNIPEKYYELVDLRNTILIAVDYYKKKVDHAEIKSMLDPLTGFYNRRAIERTIKELDSYAMILFDIDSFKVVNDQYGHQVGDEVLVFLADIVRRMTRDRDSCIRLGGDEFLIILPNTNLQDCWNIAENIRSELESTLSPTGKTISISIGIGQYPRTADDFQELYKLTDDAQYTAKQTGKNKTVVAGIDKKE